MTFLHHASLALVVSFGIAGHASAWSDTASQATTAAIIGGTSAESRAVGAALRDARKLGQEPFTPIVDRIVGSGPNAMAAAFDVLVQEQIPPAKVEDAFQLLSKPQREILLVALSRFPRKDLLDHVRADLAASNGDPKRALAAVRVFGAIGDGRDLQRIAALAPRKAEPSDALTRDASESLRTATESILARDPRAWNHITDVVRTTDRSAAKSMLEAVTVRRDPRALAVLADAVRTHPDLAPLCIAGVPKVGTTTDPVVAAEFVSWMVTELPHARPEHRRAIYQAIGVLDDGTNAGALIEGLTDADTSSRESALWGLKELTGLGFGSTPEPWRAWLDNETRWNTRERIRHRDGLRATDPERVAASLRGYAGRLAFRESLAEEVATVLERREPQLRVVACEVLGSLRAKSAIRPLAYLLSAQEAHVREAAWRALGAITGLELPREPEQAFEVLHLL